MREIGLLTCDSLAERLLQLYLSAVRFIVSRKGFSIFA